MLGYCSACRTMPKSKEKSTKKTLPEDKFERVTDKCTDPLTSCYRLLEVVKFFYFSITYLLFYVTIWGVQSHFQHHCLKKSCHRHLYRSVRHLNSFHRSHHYFTDTHAAFFNRIIQELLPLSPKLVLPPPLLKL